MIKSRDMVRPLEQVIREAYAAFGRGDVDGYLQACARDFTFHVPGTGGISGVWARRQGLHDLAAKALAISAGTFREDVEDVLANDRHAVVLARHRLQRDGLPKEYRTAHVYEVRNGQLARCFEYPADSAAFHEAWGSSQSAAA
jgi:ketosteroid isomerase-like protein